MSTATYIPESTKLDGDDAQQVLRDADWTDVLRNSFVRFRRADGFSYARSLAFQVVLAAIPGVITAVALAVIIGDAGLQSAIEEITRSVTPGPAAEMFTSAFDQAQNNADGNLTPVIAGGLATLISAVTAMAQLQRGASRIYGIDSDRPSFQRYLVATGLALTVGLLLTIGFVAISFGSSVGGVLSEAVATWWAWLRWPVGLVIVTASIALLFKVAPNRQQPEMSWLLTGGAMATVAWLLVTVGLTFYLNASSSFGETYGPLAGFIGLMLWAQLSSIAILFGLAFAAQLEGERIGVTQPAVEVDHPTLSEFLAGRNTTVSARG